MKYLWVIASIAFSACSIKYKMKHINNYCVNILKEDTRKNLPFSTLKKINHIYDTLLMENINNNKYNCVIGKDTAIICKIFRIYTNHFVHNYKPTFGSWMLNNAIKYDIIVTREQQYYILIAFDENGKVIEIRDEGVVAID